LLHASLVTIGLGEIQAMDGQVIHCALLSHSGQVDSVKRRLLFQFV
jgi:hypothetical protein